MAAAVLTPLEAGVHSIEKALEDDPVVAIGTALRWLGMICLGLAGLCFVGGVLLQQDAVSAGVDETRRLANINWAWSGTGPSPAKPWAVLILDQEGTVRDDATVGITVAPIPQGLAQTIIPPGPIYSNPAMSLGTAPGWVPYYQEGPFGGVQQFQIYTVTLTVSLPAKTIIPGKLVLDAASASFSFNVTDLFDVGIWAEVSFVNFPQPPSVDWPPSEGVYSSPPVDINAPAPWTGYSPTYVGPPPPEGWSWSQFWGGFSAGLWNLSPPGLLYNGVVSAKQGLSSLVGDVSKLADGIFVTFTNVPGILIDVINKWVAGSFGNILSGLWPGLLIIGVVAMASSWMLINVYPRIKPALEVHSAAFVDRYFTVPVERFLGTKRDVSTVAGVNTLNAQAAAAVKGATPPQISAETGVPIKAKTEPRAPPPPPSPHASTTPPPPPSGDAGTKGKETPSGYVETRTHQGATPGADSHRETVVGAEVPVPTPTPELEAHLGEAQMSALDIARARLRAAQRGEPIPPPPTPPTPPAPPPPPEPPEEEETNDQEEEPTPDWTAGVPPPITDDERADILETLPA
jgi:hypothetical protein